MNVSIKLLLALSILSAPTIAATKKSTSWTIRNTSWTPTFEKAYSEFISDIGKGKKAGYCATTDQCLRSPKANPKYHKLNPSNLSSIFADCADLPYTLRAYFSWMNDLPFSFPTSLTPASHTSGQNQGVLNEIASLQRQLRSAGFIKRRIIQAKINRLRRELNGGSRSTPDIRYNATGNLIKSKRYVQSGDNINDVIRSVSNSISTASFRTNASSAGEGKNFRDTYPVAIDRKAIVPGTVLYDANGHIAVVYEVTKSGKIHLIDAHPDNSLTAITYGEKFARTSVKIGGGFSNWRPFSYNSGSVDYKSNEELSNYSLEQYQKSSKYAFDGKMMNFYEYVRNKLSVGSLVYDPIVELRELLGELCYDFKERKASVVAAIEQRLHLKDHPSTLPSNIYGTDGEWESYSTPSRDARLKSSIREGRDLVKKLFSLEEARDPALMYNGYNLKNDLIKVYGEESLKCSINITSSANTLITLNLDQMLSSIYKQSFDPYHCVELRWGLTSNNDINNCSQTREKLDWYNEEQGLRNTIDRDYSIRMNYGLWELGDAEISNVAQEDISILGAIQNQ